MLDDIVNYGQEYNKQWITNHPDHWLTQTYNILHNKSIIFASTSCELTACMINTKLNYHNNWTLLDDCQFNHVYNNHKVFHISIGQDWTSPEHVLTVFDNYIIQSYYKKYNVRKTLITQTIIEALDNINAPNSYHTITNTTLNVKDLNVFYWLP